MDIKVKRFIDALVSFLAIVCALPLFLVIAMTIKLTSKGPVLFTQERVGLRCRCFMIYKFRTMVVDAEKVGGYQTRENDPRITWIGRFLRRTSFDELPQLYNVIKGDMSLVGPRPDLPTQKSLYKHLDWTNRHAVRPGITGYAQVEKRSNCSHRERTLMDLYYVNNNTVIFDLKIMIKTALIVFRSSGVN